MEQALTLLRDLYDQCPQHRRTSYGNSCLNHYFLAGLLPLCVDPLLVDPSHPWADYDQLDGRSGCLLWSMVMDSADSIDRRSLQDVRDHWNSWMRRAPRLNGALSQIEKEHGCP